jgi:predicted amidohydrolase
LVEAPSSVQATAPPTGLTASCNARRLPDTSRMKTGSIPSRESSAAENVDRAPRETRAPVQSGAMQVVLLVAGGCLLAQLAAPCPARPVERLRVELKDFGTGGRGATGWSAWAERDAIRPKCFVDTAHFRSAPDALAISGDGNPAEYGGWAYAVGGVRGGQFYRLTAFYRAESVPDERRQVVARLDWLDNLGHRVAQPDYAYETSADGDWKRVTLGVAAPQHATGARIELSLGWAPQGTVWWDDITFEAAPPPPARWVRVGTVSLHPRDNPDNLGAFLQALDTIAADKPDIVCLGEEILLEGNSRTYVGAAEEIPGPSTDRLGERARRYGMYIVAGLTEREGPVVYNTAVLIDRHGKVAGKYRKVYLPREEVEGGVTPGGAYPVFDTDFGKIGMMICWDGEYVDPARALAIQGAEILFVPAAGGYMTLLKARALENHLYLVSSGFDLESAIIDPTGKVLFSTLESGVVRTVSINLEDRFLDPWLGDMRPRFHKEMRGDIPVPAPVNR